MPHFEGTGNRAAHGGSGGVLVPTAAGLFCPDGRFYIDPVLPVDRAIITHAHSDHLRPGSGAYLTSTSGVPFVAHRAGDGARVQGLDYGKSLTVGGVEVTLFPAGHVRGSAQVRVSSPGGVWVVSGDYKLQADRCTEAFEPVRCDVFISECTFGLPVYRWPDPDGEISAIRKWWSENAAKGHASVLCAYSLGKAQRILAGLSGADLPIVIHGSVTPFSRMYEQAGVVLPPCVSVTSLTAEDRQQALVVGPSSILGSPWLRRFEPYASAFASGWMLIRGHRRRQGVDRGFVLSDHADWPGLLEAIESTGAERIVLTHGFTEQMVKYLRERGHHAEELHLLRPELREDEESDSD